jgi:hypothetical protein
MFAGSDPAFHSVNANAEISFRATRGRYFFLLLFGAEKQQGLRDTYGLVSRNERG